MAATTYLLFSSGGKDSILAACILRDRLSKFESIDPDRSKLVFISELSGDYSPSGKSWSGYSCNKLLLEHSRYFAADHHFVVNRCKSDIFGCGHGVLKHLLDLLNQQYDQTIAGWTRGDIIYNYDHWKSTQKSDRQRAIRLLIRQSIEPIAEYINCFEELTFDQIVRKHEDYETNAIIVYASNIISGIIGETWSRQLLAKAGILENPVLDSMGEDGAYHTVVRGIEGVQFAHGTIHRREQGDNWHLFFEEEPDFASLIRDDERFSVQVYSEFVLLSVYRPPQPRLLSSSHFHQAQS